MAGAPAPSKPLAVYLNDHLAGSARFRASWPTRSSGTGGRERRSWCRSGSRSGRAGSGWLGEKAARLKPHGRLLRNSPLAPFVELEALAVGIHGKLLMWRALRSTIGDDAAAAAPLEELVARAEGQLAAVEPHRIEAARPAGISLRLSELSQ